MADIQPLIEYLKINRTKDALEAEDPIVQVQVIDQNYDIDDDNSSINDVYKSLIDEVLGDTWKLNTIMSFYEFDTIYMRVLDDNNTKDSIQYYNRKIFETDAGSVIKYRKLGQDAWNEFPDVDFITIPLTQLSSSYYYDYTIKRIIIYNSFETVILVENALPFKPKELGIKSGRHTLEYVDHEGYDNGLFDQALKFLLDPLFKFAMDKRKRKIDVEIAEDEGKIHLFPVIKGSGDNIVLKYMYKKGRFSRFDIKYQEPAITLKFRYFGAFLEFINQTVFYVDDIKSLDWDEPLNMDEVFEVIYKSLPFVNKKIDPELLEKVNHGGIRQLFIDDYTKTVVNEIGFNRKNLEKSLEILYYAPKILVKYLRLRVLWDIVGRALEGNLTNIGLNKEDVVLKILESIYEKIGEPGKFLDALFTQKTSYQKNFLTALYDSLNTGNFTKYILLLMQQWKKSSYANILERKEIKQGELTVNPIPCGYTSGKSWSFYHENTNFDWTSDGYIKLKVTTENEGVKNYEYHPYDLVSISNAENENISFTGEQLNHITFLPALALFAHSDVTFWKNTLTVAEYTGDVVSLAVGLGPAWRSFRIVSALAKATSTTQKVFVVARSAIGVMEVTAGTANIILKATQYRDTEFGRKLANVFIWMEFASLGTDIALGVAKRLSASSKLALEEANNLLKTAKRSRADELLDAVKIKNGEIVQIARLSLAEFKQMGHLLLGQLQGARYIIANEFRLTVGAIADDIKAVGVQLVELKGIALKELKTMGAELVDGLFLNTTNFRNIPDDGVAYAAILNGKGYLATSLDEIKGFFNAMSDNLNKGASQARRGGRAGKNLDKVEEAFEIAADGIAYNRVLENGINKIIHNGKVIKTFTSKKQAEKYLKNLYKSNQKLFKSVYSRLNTKYKKWLADNNLELQVVGKENSFNLRLVNKITNKVDYIGMPDRIHSYLKFQVLSDVEKSNLIELGYQIAQNSKARFNLVKANEKLLKKLRITIKLRRSTLGSGTVPTFTPLGNAMFLKNGKLGNGAYDDIIEEGFSINDIENALQKIKKHKGVAEDIKLTGGRPSDFNHVWDAWGIPHNLGSAILSKLKLTLHHMDDVSKQTKGSFELVHRRLHKASLSHTGNFGIFEIILDLIK